MHDYKRAVENKHMNMNKNNKNTKEQWKHRWVMRCWHGSLVWTHTHQKKHSPTHTHPDRQTSFINFLHGILFVQFRSLTVLSDDLCPGPLQSSYADCLTSLLTLKVILVIVNHFLDNICYFCFCIETDEIEKLKKNNMHEEKAHFLLWSYI